MTSFVVTAFDDVVNFFKGVKSPAATIVIDQLQGALSTAEAAAPAIAEDVANAGLALLGPWGVAAQPVVDTIIVAAVQKLLGKTSSPTASAAAVAAALAPPAASASAPAPGTVGSQGAVGASA